MWFFSCFRFIEGGYTTAKYGYTKLLHSWYDSRVVRKITKSKNTDIFWHEINIDCIFHRH